jgi:uncharacterized protein (TIGR03067 family)
VAALAEGVLKTMMITKLRAMAGIILAIAIALGGTGWLAHYALADKGDGQKPFVAKPKAALQDAAKPQKDEEAIQGTWYVTKAQFNGDPVPDEDLRLFKFVVKADRIELGVEEGKKEIGFKLDPSKKPKEMAVVLTEGDEKKNGTWIYKLEGKQLTICGVEKPDGPAPKDFTAPAGSNQFVIALGRDKPPQKPEAKEEPGQKSASRAARSRSQNNLKQIALAMHNYVSTYQTFPTPAIYSKDGKPLLSWRVAILPFIEQDKLYKQFHLDEPWDSDHNKTLLAQMPKTYAPVGGDARDKESTFYQVFVGNGTIFEGPKGIKIADITDGTSNTILVVEAAEAVPWTKPADLPYDDQKPLPKLGGMLKDVFNAALADGSVHIFPEKFNEKTMRLLIIRNDGQPVDLKNIKP